MKPIIFALLAMAFWGLAPIFSKLGLAKLEPFTALTIRSVVIAVIMLVIGLGTGKLTGLAQVNPKSALLIVGEGVCAALLGQLAYYYAIKGGEVSLVSPIVAAFPIVTIAIALLFLGEKFTVQKLMGAALIIAGVIVIKR